MSTRPAGFASECSGHSQLEAPMHYVNPHVARRAIRLLPLGALLAMSPAALACSSEDRIALAQMGYTIQQIDAQCGAGNPFVTPSMPDASACVTQIGSCYLSVRATVGSQCWCQTGSGHTVPGVAQ
jgi:hypothetical protein